MTNTITLTDEQLADLNAGKSVSQGITIDPPQQTPCQQRGLREGQWVWADSVPYTSDLVPGWVQLKSDDMGTGPTFQQDGVTGYLNLDRRIDWSRGIYDEKPVEKWEPKGGNWTIALREGHAFEADSEKQHSEAGFERTRKDHADRAAKKLRQYSRLLAWRDEHCPDYEEPEMGARAAYVCWSALYGKWRITTTACADVLSVPMPLWAAEKLAQGLNTGKVEL